MESDDESSFGSIDDLDGTSPFIFSCKYFSHCSPIEEENHFHELSKQDPEFLKYLEENDPELLHFDPKAEGESENEDGDDLMEEDEQIPVLTKNHLRTWQKALLEVSIHKRVSYYSC